MLDAFPWEIRGYSQSGKWKKSSKWYRNILKLYYNYAVLQFCRGCWLNLPSSCLLSKELASAPQPYTRERVTVLGGSPGTIYGASPWGVGPASWRGDTVGIILRAKIYQQKSPHSNRYRRKQAASAPWTHGAPLYSFPELGSSIGIYNKQGILHTGFGLIPVSGHIFVFLTLSHSHCFHSSKYNPLLCTAPLSLGCNQIHKHSWLLF